MEAEVPHQRLSAGAYSLPSGLRLLIVGGSTAAGLGTRGRSFATVVTERLQGAQVLDLSLVGRLLDEHLSFEQAMRDFAPDVTLICAGISESMVHPGPKVQRIIERYAPESWHGVSGLQARPYYSTKLMKRIGQRIVSKTKVSIKRTVIRLSHGRSRMSPEDFGRNLAGLLDVMEDLGCVTIVLDLWRTDDRLFPGTDQAFEAASRHLVAAVERHPSASRVPLRELLSYWDHFLADHLHWNAAGHEFVANLVLELMAKRLSARSPGAAGQDPSPA